MRVTRSEVEEILCCDIPTELFERALKAAKQKQGYIYYLVKLTEEYVRILAFSELTKESCRMRDMEKEHSTKSQSAHTQPYCSKS